LCFNCVLLWFRSQESSTGLNAASFAGHEDVASYLIAKGADVNYANETHKWNPLISACYGGHLKVVSLLLSTKKVNVNSLDKYNQTAFDYATQVGYNDALLALLRKNGAKTGLELGFNPLPIPSGDEEEEVLNSQSQQVLVNPSTSTSSKNISTTTASSTTSVKDTPGLSSSSTNGIRNGRISNQNHEETDLTDEDVTLLPHNGLESPHTSSAVDLLRNLSRKEDVPSLSVPVMQGIRSIDAQPVSAPTAGVSLARQHTSYSMDSSLSTSSSSRIVGGETSATPTEVTSANSSNNLRPAILPRVPSTSVQSTSTPTVSEQNVFSFAPSRGSRSSSISSTASLSSLSGRDVPSIAAMASGSSSSLNNPSKTSRSNSISLVATSTGAGISALLNSNNSSNSISTSLLTASLLGVSSNQIPVSSLPVTTTTTQSNSNSQASTTTASSSSSNIPLQPMVKPTNLPSPTIASPVSTVKLGPVLLGEIKMKPLSNELLLVWSLVFVLYPVLLFLLPNQFGL
jgi:Ankyrin repeats (3 copies)